jgi:hypothetical protein
VVALGAAELLVEVFAEAEAGALFDKLAAIALVDDRVDRGTVGRERYAEVRVLQYFGPGAIPGRGDLRW